MSKEVWSICMILVSFLPLVTLFFQSKISKKVDWIIRIVTAILLLILVIVLFFTK